MGIGEVLRQDVELLMVDCTLKMIVDEVNESSSEDYRRGFIDAWNILRERQERIHRIFNTKN
jgi:hypothetical protein